LLNKNSFSLDHYLPWSFVGHDLLWNLIPTIPSVNSSKSNNIPSNEEYFHKFVDMQHLGLTISNSIMSDNQWYKYIESYLADLKIDKNNLLNLIILRKAYEATFIPLVSLAVNQGFMPEWLYLSSLES
jgi:CRISPR/Cas system Type II protein with McrA/HNH and RuvC-like nuclease domain